MWEAFRFRFLRTPLGWALSLLASALGGYLLFIHAGHVAGALPYVLLLLCPLMHLFGHRHGSHDGR
jgi:hypothetical protein